MYHSAGPPLVTQVFWPVQHVVIAYALRARLEPAGVGAGAGLAQAERDQELPGPQLLRAKPRAARAHKR